MTGWKPFVTILLACFLFLSVQASTKADWRADIAVFRVGVVADGSIGDTVARTEPFRLALEEALGVPVEIFSARDYPALIDASVDGRIEYAVFSAIAYAAASNLCECIEPLVTASNPDGATGFRNVVIASSAGPAGLADLRSFELAVPASDAAGGHLVGLFELRNGQPGLDSDAIATREFENGEEMLNAFANGEVTALLGWLPDGITDGSEPNTEEKGSLRLLAARGMDVENLRIIWRSSVVPYRVHAVATKLAAEAKNILRSLLGDLFDQDPVAYDSIEPVFGGGFLPARPSQFLAASQMLAAQGVTALPSRDDDAASTEDRSATDDSVETDSVDDPDDTAAPPAQ